VADVNDIFIEVWFDLIKTQYENINKDTLNNQNDSNLLENPIKNHKNLYYKNHCGILSSENAHQLSFKRKPEDSLNEKITKIEEIEKFYTDQVFSFKVDQKNKRWIRRPKNSKRQL
jgi:predicted NUDIX family phosphoesterase